MTVKWLGSSFRFCPGIFPTWLGRTTNTSAKLVGIQADIQIHYIQNTCQMHYFFKPTCSGRGWNEEEINVEEEEEKVCYPDTNSGAHRYLLLTCLVTNIFI